MAVADCLLNNPRLAFRFLKALGQILGIVYVHVNTGCQILLTQRFNSLHVFLSHKSSSFDFLLCFSLSYLFTDIHANPMPIRENTQKNFVFICCAQVFLQKIVHIHRKFLCFRVFSMRSLQQTGFCILQVLRWICQFFILKFIQPANRFLFFCIKQPTSSKTSQHFARKIYPQNILHAVQVFLHANFCPFPPRISARKVSAECKGCCIPQVTWDRWF